jgi:hypothetical protein
MTYKLLTLLATGALLVAAPAAMAHAMRYGRVVNIAPYSAYQGPDGTYNSYADYIRDVDGLPCGQDCSLQAQARWGWSARPNVLPARMP